ncbi:S1 family peptidase [Streptomyces sp. NPDC059063]|uniref:S1 family peptidase n=1 Tax=Streptomyces sp. NPDC059063 TaxID=3346712 RepID=UPI003680541C
MGGGGGGAGAPGAEPHEKRPPAAAEAAPSADANANANAKSKANSDVDAAAYERARRQGERRMAAQRPLVAAAGTLRSAVERGHYDGYAGIVLEDKKVALWWQGPLPSSMRAAVARAEKKAPVRIARAPHSLKELGASRTKVEAWLKRDANAPAARVKVPSDGSGLVLAVDKGDGKARAFGAAQLPDVDVPVKVVREEAPKQVSREDDWAPWSGGARIRNGNSMCSSGFGVRDGANNRYVLTAAHCGRTGDRITDAKGEFIGTFGARNELHDVALIPTSNVDDQIYVGGSHDNAVRTVDGWDWSFVGEYLCQSGATSAWETGGPVCNLKVEYVDGNRNDTTEVRQMDGLTAVRGGDSGGPVYTTSASGGVIAKGTMTWGSQNVRMGFHDFGTAGRDFGVWIAK